MQGATLGSEEEKKTYELPSTLFSLVNPEQFHNKQTLLTYSVGELKKKSNGTVNIYFLLLISVYEVS